MGHFGTSVCRFGIGGDRRQDDKDCGQQVEVAIKLPSADTACGDRAPLMMIDGPQ